MDIVQEAKKYIEEWNFLKDNTEVDLISRLVDKLEAQQWQPIETAPKDGTPILAYIPFGGGFIMQTHWKVEIEFWFCDGGEVCPSHWQSLLTPPKEGA